MMKKQFLSGIAVLITLAIYAQAEQEKWYFGNGAGLDFSSGAPVPLLNGQLNSVEACASISDAGGNLLFYSNGDDVWTSNHTLMPNGTGLAGDASATQGCLIVPKPGSNTIFYLFYIDAQLAPGGFCYSEIDMTLNSGLGDVNNNKDVMLLAQACEKLAAVRHANGVDVWVVAHEWNSSGFCAYLVTAAGISSPVISYTGSTIGSSSNSMETVGCMKFSPCGDLLAIAHAYINETSCLILMMQPE